MLFSELDQVTVPNLDWDDDYCNGPAIARIPTKEEHERFLAEQEARIAQALSTPPTPHIDPVALPQASDWSEDPFAPTLFPFGAFLEPEGYATIRSMKRPTRRSYQRFMPRTLTLARTIHQSLPEIDVWGRQVASHYTAWETITAGTWKQGVRKGKPYSFQHKAMSEWDILKMLADPSSRALANKDASVDRFSHIRHIRIDVDMDETFRGDGHDRLLMLQSEIALVHEVFAAFGLRSSIFRTGNRGIQVVAPIPRMCRSTAWVLTECVRTTLRHSRRRTWNASDFQTSLDGLMRLPFGLHWWSESLALFLDFSGRVLPVDDQVACFVDAFFVRPEDYDAAWAEEIEPWLGPTNKTPLAKLNDIVAAFPRNPLVRTFLVACDDFDVEGWEKQSVTHTKGGNREQIIDDTGIAYDLPLDVRQIVSSEIVTHTKGRKENSSSESPPALTASTLGASPEKLKRIGWDILNAGFQPGGSFEYYVNVMKGVKGRNAIGWALVVHDGDREAAKAWLDKQAEGVAGSTADIAQRKALIAWGIENNDTHERFQSRRITAKHRELCGEVIETDTEAAQRVVAVLPSLRLESQAKHKTFRQDSLVVVGHTLELMISAARVASDGLVPVSDRTLAAEISRRWPEDATNAMTVSRQMVWITKGHPDCLIGALEVVERPKKATAPMVYRLGIGF